MAIELQFYILFPALLIFVRRYAAWYVPAVIAGLIGLRAAVWFLNGVAHDIAYFSIFGALDIFLIGMLAGNLYMQPKRWELSGWTVLLAFVVLNIVIYTAHLHRSFFNYDFDHVTPDGVSRSAVWIIWPTVQGLLFAAFALVYLQSKWQIPFAGAFAYLGKISYSLYVWHTIVFLVAVRLRLRFLPPFEMGLFVILPATAAISALSYKLIEEPFLAMRVRYVRQRVAGESVPTRECGPFADGRGQRRVQARGAGMISGEIPIGRLEKHDIRANPRSWHRPPQSRRLNPVEHSRADLSQPRGPHRSSAEQPAASDGRHCRAQGPLGQSRRRSLAKDAFDRYLSHRVSYAAFK